MLERERVQGRPVHIYDSIISVENLLVAWREFLSGKRRRKDVALFSLCLTDHILMLHRELSETTYQHGGYEAFKVNDPKPRDIYKAGVRDRLLHHALYRILLPYFDRRFIYDSYSCRVGKGTHRAINRFREYARRISRNNTRTIWVLKCDIRKFFASIDHAILKQILQASGLDQDTLWLLGNVIDSFEREQGSGKGVPLGNLTSQLLVNVYMNEFDQFVKRELKAQCYIRYADDFVILHEDRQYLKKLLLQISTFLVAHLRLALHPNKVLIGTVASGIDFLGWVHFSHHRVLRTVTKKRIMKRVTQYNEASYRGLLRHGNAYTVEKRIMNRLNVD